MNLVDIVRKLWNNDGRDRPWGYVMPVTIITAGNLDEEDGDEIVSAIPVYITDAPSSGGAPAADASTIAQIAASASDVLILAANPLRKGAMVYNDSSVLMTLALKSTVSTTSFTLKIQPSSYYEVPFGYNGPLHGLWASATGFAYVTEVI